MARITDHARRDLAEFFAPLPHWSSGTPVNAQRCPRVETATRPPRPAAVIRIDQFRRIKYNCKPICRPLTERIDNYLRTIVPLTFVADRVEYLCLIPCVTPSVPSDECLILLSPNGALQRFFRASSGPAASGSCPPDLYRWVCTTSPTEEASPFVPMVAESAR